MAWNGSGTFVRTQDFSADRDAGAPDHFIDADKMDNELDGMATGISACLAKNGENAATADLDIGGFRLKQVATATAVGDALNWLDSLKVNYAADTGAADAYVITPSPVITAYATGQMFCFFASATNTGASTLNVNSKGAKAIQINGAALSAGDITQDSLVTVVYDGTQFQMLPQSSGSFSVVQDTTPQLGGMLDVNGQALGDGTLELLKFSETGSAVNEFTIANAATGNGPTLSATGDDTNIDVNITPKGSGKIIHNGPGLIDNLFMNEQSAADADVAGDGQWWVKDSAPNRPMFTDDAGTDFEINQEVIVIACSDETSALTTGTAKVTFRMPFAMTLSAVRASLTGAGSTGGTTTVDINEGGTTILSTKLTIDATEKTSTTAATAAVISDSALADDAEITIDIDAVSTGADETGLKVYLIGTRAS